MAALVSDWLRHFIVTSYKITTKANYKSIQTQHVNSSCCTTFSCLVYYTIIYFYRGKYGLASRGELNHRIYRGKSKISVLLHVHLVFEEHICRINLKETSMMLSATIKIWRETSLALYPPQMTSSEVAIALNLFAQPRFKPIGGGGGVPFM